MLIECFDIVSWVRPLQLCISQGFNFHETWPNLWWMGCPGKRPL